MHIPRNHITYNGKEDKLNMVSSEETSESEESRPEKLDMQSLIFFTDFISIPHLLLALGNA